MKQDKKLIVVEMIVSKTVRKNISNALFVRLGSFTAYRVLRPACFREEI
jgi:hypothetical protein